LRLQKPHPCPIIDPDMKANTSYKSSVFTLLFSDPDLLRELYCALEGVSLPDDTPVTINTLNNVLYMDRVNDISFEIGGKIVVLIEHQSTVNPNMPLRLLMYIARVYEKILGERNLYSSKPVKIPQVVFLVLYNGTAPRPDSQILRLSDMFEEAGPLGLPERESPALELAVKVLNINHGRNGAIAARCKTLAGYSIFIEKVREFERESGERAEAIRLAVRHCRNHEILKEFLEIHSTEVQNMLITEWNMDDALAVRYAEGMEEGLEEGLERGMEEGMEKRDMAIAKNALAKGLSLELIHDLTGLDMETITDLQADSLLPRTC